MKQDFRIAFAVGKQVLKDQLAWRKALLFVVAVVVWDVLNNWLSRYYSVSDGRSFLLSGAVVVLAIFILVGIQNTISKKRVQ